MKGPQVDILLIAPAEEMTDDHFILHFNNRHAESLSRGQGPLPLTKPRGGPGIDPIVLRAYRAFHKRLHETLIDLPHEHEEALEDTG